MRVFSVRQTLQSAKALRESFSHPGKKTIRMNLIESASKFLPFENIYCFPEPVLKDGLYKKLYNLSRHIEIMSRGYKIVKLRDKSGKKLNEYVNNRVVNGVLHKSITRWDKTTELSTYLNPKTGCIDKCLRYYNKDGDLYYIRKYSVGEKEKDNVKKFKEIIVRKYGQNCKLNKECEFYQYNDKNKPEKLCSIATNENSDADSAFLTSYEDVCDNVENSM